jgi:hypothetical protein
LSHSLSLEGYEDVRDVASGLADYIREAERTPYSISIGRVWTADTRVSRATAAVLCGRLKQEGVMGEIELTEREDLDPQRSSPYAEPKTRQEFVGGLKQDVETELDQLQESGSRKALLIVGHQPLLTWLAAEFLRPMLPRLSSSPLPSLRSSELACLRRSRTKGGRERWSLMWTLSSSDPDTLRDLRDKVKSKMDVAKILGGFIAAALAFLLNDLLSGVNLRNPGLAAGLRFAAAVSFFAAAWLYLATVYFYDRLLMPVRFWGEGGPSRSRPPWLIWRPPTSDVWILYQNMIRVWRRTFMPATFLVGLGLLLAAGAQLRPMTAPQLWGVAAAALVLVVSLFGYTVLSRPRLGVQD